jgi:hypothetical protein
MQRHAGDRGAALILLIGITAVLAILAAAGVMVLANQQRATASDRKHKTSMDYAEAGLDFAVNAVKSKAFSQSASFVPTATVAADFAAADASAPPLKVRVYDNAPTVDPVVSGVTYPTPAFDQNGDDIVWVEVQVTFLRRSTRLREQVVQRLVPISQAVLFSDKHITANGTSDFYAVSLDGTPDISGPPYQTDVTCRWNLTGNPSFNLAAPSTTAQSLGVYVRGEGSDMLSGYGNFQPPPGIPLDGIKTGGEVLDQGPPVVIRPYVPLLSDYFNQAKQAALIVKAKAGFGPSGKGFAIPNTPVYTTQTALLAAMTHAGNTYTAPPGVNLTYSGNLTLNTAGTTYNFNSLYVTGNLTLNGTTTTNTTALYVSGAFTISGPVGPQMFGPIYVGVDANWSGGVVGNPLSVQTTDYTNPDPNQEPGPMYVGALFSASGVYDHVLGPTWVVGHPATGDAAVTFTATSSSTVRCRLMATTEKITTSGPCSFGTVAKPMILYMACDNDELYSNTCAWGSTGTFTGIMALMEAAIIVSNGNGVIPNIVGALFCAFNVTLNNASSICYNQAAIDAVGVIDVTVTSRTTVPGTWQELSAN